MSETSRLSSLASAPCRPFTSWRHASGSSALPGLPWLLALLLLSVLLGACDGTDSSSDSASAPGSGPSSAGGQSGPTRGRGGSTARMTIAGDYLYAIAGSDTVQLFDITQPSSPNPWARVRIDWDIQTLFPYGDYLLIGAADGLHILDNTDPASPRYIADFTHARADDPVVASDGYAYVTLKSLAGGTVNDQLDVVDLSDMTAPRLVNTLAMQGPAGLAVADGRLYVCDGRAGIKIFELSDRTAPRAIGGIPDVDCRDIIVTGSLLVAITENAVLQYDVGVSPATRLSVLQADTADATGHASNLQ